MLVAKITDFDHDNAEVKTMRRSRISVGQESRGLHWECFGLSYHLSVRHESENRQHGMRVDCLIVCLNVTIVLLKFDATFRLSFSFEDESLCHDTTLVF